MGKNNSETKKRNPIGCLFFILLIGVLITTMTQQLGKKTANSKVRNQEEIVALKDETFSMFEDIYNININLTKGLESVVNGNLSSVDYYDLLKRVKEHSLNRVKFIEEKSKRIKDNDIIENLEPYSAVYTKFLMITDNMINNLEDPNLEILSKTKKLVEETNILIKYIEDERSNLLMSLGIDESEVEEILESENEKIKAIKEES